MKQFVLVVLLVFVPLGWIAIPNLYTAMQRSKQKRTMAEMVAASERIETRRKLPPLIDAWGHRMQFRVVGPHFAIRSAAAGGRFENTKPRGGTSRFEDDIVLMNGKFVQFPSGICARDVPGKGPLANCTSCHSGRIATY